MRASRAASILAAAALLAGGGAAAMPAAGAAGPGVRIEQAPPQPSRRGRRYLHQLLELGVFGGGRRTVTGYDWIYARTHGFRRKGVGGLWRRKMHAR